MSKHKSGFIWFKILFYFMMQQQTQKTRFLRVDRTRKSQISVLFRQAGIIIFQLSNIVYCNKLRTNEMYNSQKHVNNPHLHPKIIVF